VRVAVHARPAVADEARAGQLDGAQVSVGQQGRVGPRRDVVVAEHEHDGFAGALEHALKLVLAPLQGQGKALGPLRFAADEAVHLGVGQPLVEQVAAEHAPSVGPTSQRAGEALEGGPATVEVAREQKARVGGAHSATTTDCQGARV